MKQLSRAFSYFSKFELALWGASVVAITAAFCLFDGSQYLTLAASLIGVTSLIFNAKGNPFGQFLMVVFSFFYGYISFTYDYFGEMMTYLGMTMPMAAFALVSWLRHPYRGKKSEVEVNRLGKNEIALMSLLTLAVTVAFYFILRHFHTANLLPSTLSVTTSFAAVYLTFRRSSYFAVLYAMNDVVLIVLWILASRENTSYVSVTVCFAAFLVNDAYGFYNWKRMERQQKAAPPDKS